MKPDDLPAGTPEADPIRRQAADWVIRRDAGFSAQEQDDFFAWLAADPRHAEAYARLQDMFRRLDVMVEWRPLHAREPNPDLLATPRPRFRPTRVAAWLGGLAAVLAVGFGLWLLRPAASSPVPVRLAAGETARSAERHALEDGSVVVLNRGAQVAVRYEPGRRVLDLIAGEAYFQVAEDKARPFVVRVGGTAVTAVGTEFNIALGAQRVEVLVTKGRVRVDPPAAAATAFAAPPPAERLLGAGQALVVTPDAPTPWVVEAYTPQRVEQRLAWKDDLVDFHALPLSEVILEFNRRNHTQLVIGDDALGRLTITGSLRLSNLDGFLELLTVTHGVHIERHGTSKIVLTRAP